MNEDKQTYVKASKGKKRQEKARKGKQMQAEVREGERRLAKASKGPHMRDKGKNKGVLRLVKRVYFVDARKT